MCTLSQESTIGVKISVAFIVLRKIRGRIVAVFILKCSASTGDGEIDAADGIEVSTAAWSLAA